MTKYSLSDFQVNRRTRKQSALQNKKKSKKPAETLCILIADRDFAANIVYTAALKLRGHQVTKVFSASEAVDAAFENDFDVIVVDTQLSLGEDIALLPLLRKANREARVLVVSPAKSDRKNIARLHHEADHFLNRSDVTPEELIETIEMMVGL